MKTFTEGGCRVGVAASSPRAATTPVRHADTTAMTRYHAQRLGWGVLIRLIPIPSVRILPPFAHKRITITRPSGLDAVDEVDVPVRERDVAAAGAEVRSRRS